MFALMTLVVFAGIVVGGAALLRALFLFVTVSGESMSPTLLPQDRVLMLKRRSTGRLKKGAIVLLKNPVARPSSPNDALVVKRIVALGGETFFLSPSTPAHHNGPHPLAKPDLAGWPVPSGQVFVCSDNLAASRDSREWGSVPLDSIQGVVIYHFKHRAQLSTSGDRFSLSFLLRGQQAPDFTATGICGKCKTLHKMRGHQILLLFTAYHQLARQILPTLLPQLATVADQGMTIWIICDGSRERAQRMQEEFQIPFPVLEAPKSHSSIYNDYHIIGTPCYYLIDEHGYIADAGIPGAFYSRWNQLCTMID